MLFDYAFSTAFDITAGSGILAGFGGMTVQQFAGPGMTDVGAFIFSQGGDANLIGLSNDGGVDGFLVINGNDMLSGTVNNPAALGGIDSTTNLMGVSLNTSNPTTMFDYMGDTSFATFNSFIGMNTKYVKDHPANAPLEGNLGIRYSGSTDIGLNYTLNYYYHYDNNPVIDISWEGSAGQALTTNTSAAVPTAQPGVSAVTMSLLDNGAAYTGVGTMVFTETQNRINTFGTSFDYAIDTPFAPVILRTEIVYDKDTLQPVVDLGKLAYGDFAGAFTK